MKKSFISLFLLLFIISIALNVSACDVKTKVSNMSLRQKIGQLMLLDFKEWKQSCDEKPLYVQDANSEILSIISNYNIGGVVLFSSNLSRTDRSVKLIYDMQKAAIESGNIPMLINVDQEGGIVTRLGQGTCTPGNMAIGATRDPNCAYAMGQIIGSELKALGINSNNAPCADVNNNFANPVIGLRSYGEDEDLVSEMSVSSMKGVQSKGVVCVGKHFLGHGDTSKDSHFDLPSVNKDYKGLRKKERKSFESLIKNGVDVMMVAHIQYPNVDDDKLTTISGEKICPPATLSKKIISGILREDLGFNGVVMTDAMDMKALSNNFDKAYAAKMAINAGVDILCIPAIIHSSSDIYELDRIYKEIEQAVKSGEIPMSRIDESVTRILNLKEKYGILNQDNYKEDVNEKIKKAKSIVGCNEHRRLEREVALKAITLLKNDNEVLPFKLIRDDRLLVFVPFENETGSVKYAVKKLIREGKIPNIEPNIICYNKNFKVDKQTKEEIDKSNYVIILTEMCGVDSLKPLHWITSYPRSVVDYCKQNAIKDKVACISIGLPYDTANYKDSPALMAAYGYVGMNPADDNLDEPENMYGPNIPAAIETCFGYENAQGELPVTIPNIIN